MVQRVPESIFDSPTFIELLQQRAVYQSDRPAFTFLLDGETEEATLTYAELDLQARAIAAQLQIVSQAGERALLLFPPGLEYIAAFFGCLYAGIIAVPVYPPDPTQVNRTLPRLQAIIHDAEPSFALTTSSILAMAEAMLSSTPAFSDIHWLATDQIDIDSAKEWRTPNTAGESLAFLQYTSGSTATPKGVMLSHSNLLHNSKLIYKAFGHSAESQGVIWLPPYHDMGLIGGILQPLYGGFPVTLMSSMSFLRKPLRWLQAISRYKATTSGGPNFAYDLCVGKVAPEQLDTLDLSSWQVAFNGAEPIRAETLERFVSTFSSCGFDQKAFYPCYGLAEATLIVSASSLASPPTVRNFLSSSLEQHQAIAYYKGDEECRTLVSSGRNLLEQRVVIVQPDTQIRCQPGQVGEIWVSGPSIAQGYWNQPSLTEEKFKAYPRSGTFSPHKGFIPNPDQVFMQYPQFLRTGDLGFIDDSELFVTGRLKDLIIIRGRNYYPQDIELTVQKSHPALRPGYGAAFSVTIENEERLVIIQEVLRSQTGHHFDHAIHAIRQQVAEQHEIQTYAIVLIKAGSIPRTSSGKIQRYLCRNMFMEQNLTVVAQNIREMNHSDVNNEEDSFVYKALHILEKQNDRELLLAHYLQEQATQFLNILPTQAEPSSATSNFDRLATTDFQQRIEADLKVRMPEATLLQNGSFSQMASRILQQLSFDE